MDGMMTHDGGRARAERDAQRLADFFDMDRQLNERADRHPEMYKDRDHAYSDWFIDQVSVEEGRCFYSDEAARKLAHVEAKLLEWLGAAKAKQIIPLLALPHEMRLIKLFRLHGSRKRVERERNVVRQTP